MAEHQNEPGGKGIDVCKRFSWIICNELLPARQRNFTVNFGHAREKLAQELLDAHISLAADSMLHKLLKSCYLDRPLHSFGDRKRIWIFYKISRKNERPDWIKEKVLKGSEHHIEGLWTVHSPTTKRGYEHMRTAQDNEIAKKFLEGSLERNVMSNLIHIKRQHELTENNNNRSSQ